MWEKMMFSDEITYSLLGSKAHMYVRRFPGREFMPECLNLTKVLGMVNSGVGRR